MPAVVAAGNLMPLRGIKFDPIVRVQSWPIGEDKFGEWWVHEGPLSRAVKIEAEMRDLMGAAYVETDIETPFMMGPTVFDHHGNAFLGDVKYDDGKPIFASRMGVSPTREEMEEHHRASRQPLPDVSPRYVSPQRYAYNGGLVRADGDVEAQKAAIDRRAAWHEEHTVRLQDQLATVCRWGA
jgi:hypothetical protein